MADDLKQAIRILTEHVGMSTDARRQIAVALGDQPAEPPPPPPDPRDVALANMRAEMDAMKAALNPQQGVAPVEETPQPEPAVEPTPEPAPEPEPETVPEPTPEPEAPVETPVDEPV